MSFTKLMRRLARLMALRLPTKDRDWLDADALIDHDIKLSGDLTTDLKSLSQVLGNSFDLVIRHFDWHGRKGAIVFFEGLVEKTELRESIIGGILTGGTNVDEASRETSLRNIIHATLDSRVIALVDGNAAGYVIDVPSTKYRQVDEPSTEAVVRGPREAFIESIIVNVALVRRRLRSPDLRVEQFTLGRRTRTEVRIAYLDGVADSGVVDEVRQRLNKITGTSEILESGYIEELIEDAPYSVFATMGNTEKPDKVAASLLEGRIAIFVDGTPFVLTVPYVFAESIQVTEDYYVNYYYGTFLRLLRLVATLLTTLLPGLYVAASSFNPESLPTPLLITMAAAIQGIPFPAFAEVLLLGIIFETLREAGLRLPKQVGQAVSIVGALVVGQEAVSAGLVSGPAVIVTAMTGIASFVVPFQAEAFIAVRILLTILSAALGFFGLSLGMAITVIHMSTLRSFGIPYLSPFAPLSMDDLDDSFARFPLWFMARRPKLIARADYTRRDAAMPPSPQDKARR